MVIEGVHLFQGITDATMAHGEGWQYSAGWPLPRARGRRRPRLLDLTSATTEPAASPPNHARVGRPAALVLGARGLLPLLHRRSPAGAHRRVPAAQPGVPAVGAVRGGVRRVGAARASRSSPAAGAGGRAERLAGRLHASLDYGQVDEILNDDPHAYLERHRPATARRFMRRVYQTYIAYPIEAALPA